MSRRLPFPLIAVTALAASFMPLSDAAVQDPSGGSLNKAERLEWFRDQGFGLFIHWNVDCQLGSVISHSLVGASKDYERRYFGELPGSFNPRKFHPEDWADLAKLAGIRYVVLTAKHHAGFCLWPTGTTGFSVAQTPFRRDITAEVLQAFRSRGIAPGLYFSPDDFWWLWKHGIPIQRGIPSVQPSANPGLMRHDQAQLRELLTGYGPIDLLFFDGEGAGLLSAVQGTIFHLGCERGVNRIKAVGKLDVESDAGPVGEFPPLVGAEDGVGFGDGGAGVEEFDFSLDRANDQFGFGKWFGKVGALGRKGLFRFLPEGGGGR